MNCIKYILVAMVLLFVSTAQAQHTTNISGSILKDGKPAEGATVSLLRARDTVAIKLAVANKEGVYFFENIANGKYLICVTAIGHKKTCSDMIEAVPSQSSIQVPVFWITTLNKEMAAITVTTKRPLIEQRIDRTIVNVDASITNIGTSALEVLEKSPGVSVDRDGNISLKGKEGVLVMIDGRPMQLGGADLAALLRNMSSNQLDQIEIMTNPPARYDAAGTAGVINLKTKKISTAGFNGSASVTYSQGRYPKTAESFAFNYRESKVNLFTALSHNYQKRFSTLSLDRNLLVPNATSIDKIFNQVADRISAGNSYSAKIGADFFATKKTTVGAVINLSSRDLSSVNSNITKISNASKDLQSVTNALVTNKTGWTSVSANLNFRTLLPKGRELTSDLDMAQHSMGNDLFMANSYTDAVGNAYTKADTLTGVLPQHITVYTGRVDYLQPLKKGARFEAGLKSGFVKTDNNAVYDSLQNGSLIHDATRSNHFIYEENINAAYLNLSTPLSKKWSAQLGLRVENTAAKGRQLTTGETFTRHYTQLFPTAYLQYKATDENTFGVNFARRVSRPGYQSLNPFIKFIDRYTFSQGNPALKPSVSENFELSHTWKSQITTTINYTHIKDIIHEIIQQKGQEAYNMPANVSSLKQFGIAVSANTSFTKWWTNSININLYNDHYKGDINKASIDRSATTYIFSGTQQFKINNTLTAELNEKYRNSSLEGVLLVKPVGSVGAGLSQQVLKNKGTIRLTARDIFWTQRMKGITQYGNVDVEMRQVSETQVVAIGFSYSFSKGKKIAPVKRINGGAGDEQNRIGNN